jgi:hypothetical protein
MKRRLVPIGLAVAAAVVAVPAAAQAAPASPIHVLALSVAEADGQSRTVLLDCDAPSSTHPLAREACTVLAPVNGNIAAIAPTPGICVGVYLPVTAKAVGVWGIRPVTYQKAFSNACVLRLATGPVFAF